MTVPPRNLEQVADVVRDCRAMGFRVFSFQPAAYIGNRNRWKDEYRSFSSDQVWSYVERGAGSRLPYRVFQTGDERCNRTCHGILVGERFVPLVADRVAADHALRDAFYATFGGMDFQAPLLAPRIARALARRPSAPVVAAGWAARFAARAGIVPLLRGPRRPLTFVMHSFMDARDVRPAWEALQRGERSPDPRIRATQERLQACSYAMAHPESGQLVPARAALGARPGREPSTSGATAAMTRVLAFDVNETLLDLSPLDPLFERALGSAALRQTWFSQMLQLAFVGGLTGRYVDFASAGRAALAMVAAAEGVTLDDGAAERITGELRRLPPHPDAEPALVRLREAGFTLAALTNSTLEVAREQLGHAGLADRFDEILSADQVRALKPRPEPYRLVAETCGVEPGGVRLIAAHAWDVAGALAAGCAAAFVRRPGKVPSPLGDQPDIVGDDLVEVADRIVAVDRERW